jgi:large repetitive protein
LRIRQYLKKRYIIILFSFIILLNWGLSSGYLASASSTPIITTPNVYSYTNNQKPDIIGTAQANAKINISIDGTIITNAATANMIGNWKYTIPANLYEGSHNIIATDFTSGAASNIVTIIIDITAPNPPIISSFLNGLLTNIQKPFINGTAEPNSKITLTIDGTSFADASTADASGYWNFMPTAALSDGLHTITAVAKDIASNTSILSLKTLITIDTKAPDKPIIDTSLNNIVTNKQKPIIFGKAEINSKITINIDGTIYPDVAITDAGGNWSYTPNDNLPDGPHNISVLAKDAANNSGLMSLATMITIDTVSPDPPVIAIPINGSIINNLKPDISGTAQANSKVVVIIDGSEIADAATSNIIGNWIYKLPVNLTEGIHSISGYTIDKANNKSVIGTEAKVTVDIAAPSPPIITAPLNGISTNIQKPIINGNAEANSKITVNIDGSDIQDAAIADSSGNWSYTVVTKLAEGVHNIFAKAKDMAGNQGTQSQKLSITVDTIPPKTPIIITPVDGETTTNKRPIINGTGDPNSIIQINIDGINVNEGILLDSSGKFYYKPVKDITKGSHIIEISAKDDANNFSVLTTEAAIIIKNPSPKKPIIKIPKNNSKSKEKAPVINGIAGPNLKINLTISLGKTIVSLTGVSNSNGAWSMKPAKGLNPGVYKIIAKARDADNNVSDNSIPITITIIK